MSGSEKLIPRHLSGPFTESWKKFSQDHDPSKAVFIMMKFDDAEVHSRVLNTVRSVLKTRGLEGLRADSKEYHADLYWNVVTYMLGCGYGVAILDYAEKQEFNPNVLFELGFMKGLDKKVCILKDENLKELPTDLLGWLYKPFNPKDPESTIRDELSTWLSDYEIGTEISFIDRQISVDLSKNRPISINQLSPEETAILQSRPPSITNVKVYRDKEGKVIVQYDES